MTTPTGYHPLPSALGTRFFQLMNRTLSSGSKYTASPTEGLPVVSVFIPSYLTGLTEPSTLETSGVLPWEAELYSASEVYLFKESAILSPYAIALAAHASAQHCVASADVIQVIVSCLADSAV